MSQPSASRYCPICGLATSESLCPSDGATTVAERVVFRDARSYGPGDVVGGRYRIVGRIAAGAFGAVYSARHTGTDQPCALKLLTAEIRGEAGSSNVKRFFREARITAALDHPNTVRVFDVGQTDEGPVFLAMELLDGPTLDGWLRHVDESAQTMSEPATIDILVQVLAGLGAAHDAGLVHRDIKPGNVILTRGRDDTLVVKVVDFGIARVDGQRQTTAGYTVGTPAYMSPEQCTDKPLDGRADLYAVAVMGYQAVAGRLPFEGSNPMALMYAHCHDTSPDPRQWSKETLSEELVAWLMRNLAKDPAERFASARLARDALLAIRAQHWSESPPFRLPQALPIAVRIDPWGQTDAVSPLAGSGPFPATARSRPPWDGQGTPPADSPLTSLEDPALASLPAPGQRPLQPTPMVMQAPPLTPIVPAMATPAPVAPVSARPLPKMGFVIAGLSLVGLVVLGLLALRTQPVSTSQPVPVQAAMAAPVRQERPPGPPPVANPVPPAPVSPPPAPVPPAIDPVVARRKIEAEVSLRLSNEAKDLDQQLAFARRAVELDPDHPATRKRLAELLEAQAAAGLNKPAPDKVIRPSKPAGTPARKTAPSTPSPEPERKRVQPQLAD